MDELRAPRTDAERLADFTDRLLAGEQPEGPAAPSEGRELLQLEATLRSIQRNLPPRQPAAELRNRIRARLSAEWNASGPQGRRGTGPWRPARTVFAAWIAGLVTLLILAGAFLVSRLPAWVPGTAQAQGTALVIVLVALGIIAIIFLWRRQKP
jgi:hypothetical protein